MPSIRSLKYLFVWTGIAAGLISLKAPGIWSYTLPIYAFGIIPLLELFIRPNPRNLSQTEEDLTKANRLYDWQLYIIVPLQYWMVAFMCWKLSQPGLTPMEIVGKLWAVGIGCGVLGINVAHELGHRNTRHEQFLSKALLLTSLYMHFFIEHNRGHHKNVSTPEDPASSRKGEWIYTFWLRSVWGSYWSAWEIENKRIRKLGKPILSLHNEMVIYHILQAAAIALVAWIFGWQVMLYFIAVAISGFLLLETVNYIEHYGLLRKQLPNGTYESVQPAHSWNSDHILGRLLLFELSRHSDHHYRAGRKFQTLRHMEGSPQMPTGYPGMMVLALFPPLWFRVMHRQVSQYEMKKEMPREMVVA